MKRLLTAILALLFTVSCGYKIAGLDGTEFKDKFHLDRVAETTQEADITTIIENEALVYLSAYDALADKQNADYDLELVLTNISSSSDIGSASGRETSATLSAVFKVTVSDMQGNSVYERKFSSRQTYSVTSSPSQSRANWEAALKEAVRSAMNDLRNNFEQTDK